MTSARTLSLSFSAAITTGIIANSFVSRDCNITVCCIVTSLVVITSSSRAKTETKTSSLETKTSYFKTKTDKRNTKQLHIAHNNSQSFVNAVKRPFQVCYTVHNPELN